MANHAQCSPSGSGGWLKCSFWESNPTNSAASEEGTAAHELAESSLLSGRDCAEFVGITTENGIVVTDEMAAEVQKYVDVVRNIGGELYVEHELDISAITGEPDAKGTSDAVILSGDTLYIVDLKYGRYQVEARDNSQLMIYALSALLYSGLDTSNVQKVHLLIAQPRINNFSEWVTTPVELENFGDEAYRAAQLKLKGTGRYGPGEKSCKWCAKSGKCEEQATHVLNLAVEPFVVMTEPLLDQVSDLPACPEAASNDRLADYLQVVDYVEEWCRSVRRQADKVLNAGGEIPGFKLVAGRKGARQWSNPLEAEKVVSDLIHYEQLVYDRSLKSPTTFEKLAKAGQIDEGQWAVIQSLYTQKEGAPAVVPYSDKRPAINTSFNFPTL